jgi:hypothetical protein
MSSHAASCRPRPGRTSLPAAAAARGTARRPGRARRRPTRRRARRRRHRRRCARPEPRQPVRQQRLHDVVVEVAFDWCRRRSCRAPANSGAMLGAGSARRGRPAPPRGSCSAGWPAGRWKSCTVPLGQRTSARSIVVAAPRPKCSIASPASCSRASATPARSAPRRPRSSVETRADAEAVAGLADAARRARGCPSRRGSRTALAGAFKLLVMTSRSPSRSRSQTTAPCATLSRRDPTPPRRPELQAADVVRRAMFFSATLGIERNSSSAFLLRPPPTAS